MTAGQASRGEGCDSKTFIRWGAGSFCLALGIYWGALYLQTGEAFPQSRWPYFEYYAQSLLDGHLYFTRMPPSLSDLSFYGDRLYMRFPPFPSILMARRLQSSRAGGSHLCLQREVYPGMRSSGGGPLHPHPHLSGLSADPAAVRPSISNGGQVAFRRERLSLALPLVAVVTLCLIPVFLLMGTGEFQFGHRYSSDLQVLLCLLVILGLKDGVNRISLALLVFSILMSSYGAWWFVSRFAN
jgi:hypothetical protein